MEANIVISLITGLEILGVISGGIYLVGKIDANTKANQEALNAATATNQKAIAQLADLLKQNMHDMKEMIQMQKEQQRENLNREISHIKDLISISNNEMREDIKRLENAQREANRVKERTALLESSLRSLHKRLDIEPPLSISKEEE